MSNYDFIMEINQQNMDSWQSEILKYIPFYFKLHE